MQICKKCGKSFSSRITIEGKIRVINSRQYCLECSPFGKHNTRKLDMSVDKRRSTDNGHKQQTNFRKKRKEQLVALKGGGCVICGYNKCVRSLHFHHIDPKNKLFDLCSSMTVKPLLEIKKEVDKTILLCSNCHGEIHSGMHLDIIEKMK